MATYVGEAFASRLAGQRASRVQALIVAAVAGGTAGAVAYRWLRSGGAEQRDDDG
jgi:hypothetical protein